MKADEFLSFTKENGLILSEKQAKQFATYLKFLQAENEKYNLTAIVEEEEIYEKHFADCLLSSFIKKPSGKYLDIGSGAGFPGIVLKIAYPELEMDLLEPIGKRCNFLRQCIELLDLENINVIQGRGEEYSKQKEEEYDYVSARAVSNLAALLEIATRAIKIDGYFVALRGSSGKEDILEASKATKLLGLELIEEKEVYLNENKRYIAFYQKKKKTDKKYPRPYNKIKSKPL